MDKIKIFFALFLCALGSLVWAETNTPAKKSAEQVLEIDSDSGVFDGMTNRIVYSGHVFVTDHSRSTLKCERLTVDLPPNGGNPTNILAEVNVIIDLMDSKGQTNHITAAKAIYAYHVVSAITNGNQIVAAVTNETITFAGDNPKVESPQFISWGDPLVMDVLTKKFSGIRKTIISGHSTGTNGLPFKF